MDLRYPIGKFQMAEHSSEAQRQEIIASIAEAPKRFRDAVAGLSDAQLETSYREGGWTVRQVIHHVADSHMNAYIRTKWALTEAEPTIKPYDEKSWAELEDAKRAPLEPSLALLDSLHDRWVRLLRSLTPEQWKRTFRHPEMGPMTLEKTLALYAWHGPHHIAHVTELRKRMSW